VRCRDYLNGWLLYERDLNNIASIEFPRQEKTHSSRYNGGIDILCRSLIVWSSELESDLQPFFGVQIFPHHVAVDFPSIKRLSPTVNSLHKDRRFIACLPYKVIELAKSDVQKEYAATRIARHSISLKLRQNGYPPRLSNQHAHYLLLLTGSEIDASASPRLRQY
jgi:hypothetical protein